MILRPRRRAPAMLLAGALASVVGLGVGLGVSLAPTPAGAGPPEQRPTADERVLIRVVPQDHQVSARLRAELGLLGLTATRLDVRDDAPTLGPDLLDHLDAGDASAAIEIAITKDRIDVWVADGNTGKTLNRRLDLALDPEQQEPRTLAIAAVELLRASRLELAQGTEPPHPSADDSAEAAEIQQIRESERPPRPHPELPSYGAASLAVMAGGSPGGFGVSTHIELAGRWAPIDRFALRGSVWFPIVGNAIMSEAGNVRMFVGMAFLEPQLRLPGGAPWFHPELGLGVGAAVVGYVGDADEGLRGETLVIPGFAGHSHVGLGFVVRPRVWIRLDGYVGVLLPQPQVKALGETVGTWGAPFGTGSLGLEIWL
jgi:hypothetical protein